MAPNFFDAVGILVGVEVVVKADVKGSHEKLHGEGEGAVAVVVVDR